MQISKTEERKMKLTDERLKEIEKELSELSLTLRGYDYNSKETKMRIRLDGLISKLPALEQQLANAREEAIEECLGRVNDTIADGLIGECCAKYNVDIFNAIRSLLPQKEASVSDEELNFYEHEICGFTNAKLDKKAIDFVCRLIEHYKLLRSQKPEEREPVKITRELVIELAEKAGWKFDSKCVSCGGSIYNKGAGRIHIANTYILIVDSGDHKHYSEWTLESVKELLNA